MAVLLCELKIPLAVGLILLATLTAARHQQLAEREAEVYASRSDTVCVRVVVVPAGVPNDRAALAD
jgi:hypothetical protein